MFPPAGQMDSLATTTASVKTGDCERTYHGQQQSEVQYSMGSVLPSALSYGMAENTQFRCDGNTDATLPDLTSQHTFVFNDSGLPSHSDHDPNTEGAFGDMDME